MMNAGGSEGLSHTAPLTTRDPGLVVFLVDQSDPSHAAPTFGEAATDLLNRSLFDAAIRCKRHDGVRDRVHFAFIPIGTWPNSKVLTTHHTLPISLAAQMVQRVEKVEIDVPDGNGGVLRKQVTKPIWVDPGGTAGYLEWTKLEAVLATWTAQHPNGFPPVVILIDAGTLTEQDLADLRGTVESFTTADGSGLLLAVDPSIDAPFYRSDAPPTGRARVLWDHASYIPEVLTWDWEQQFGAPESSIARVLAGGPRALTDFLTVILRQDSDAAFGRVPGTRVHAREAFQDTDSLSSGGRPMAYTAQINRANPTMLLFLVDQSGSMGDSWSGGQGTKANQLADIMNRFLFETTMRCKRPEGIRDYFHIGVIGYGEHVGSALAGPLAGRDLVPISEIANRPTRVEQRQQEVPDGAGGTLTKTIKFPVWFEPKASQGTPMVQAFKEALRVTDQFIKAHPSCFPPTIVNITDGESTDGDPSSLAADLARMASADGNVIVLNLHISGARGGSAFFPSSEGELPDEHARKLFNMSSVLPEPIRKAAEAHSIPVNERSRGFGFNAQFADVVKFLNIGTQAADANLR